MPTGGGKSMCFQIPAVTMPGVCLVISPLIALMKDQVESLKANGIEAAFMNSSQTYQQQQAIEDDIFNGKIKLLYVSPEKMVSQSFLPLLSRMNINLIAIDEAHCISAWGHDFRPEYTQMAFLKRQFPNVPVLALTATADKTTRKDIVKQLGLSHSKIFLSSFDRPNLSLKVLPARKRIEYIVSYIRRRPNDSGIVYCTSRNNTEKVAQKLKANGIKAEAYHAGMSSRQRSQIQEDFINDKTPIICATVAFGMGIDKSNIRWILHYNMPKNIESYYQEIGRAGRDGVESDTVLFYTYQDVAFWERMIEESTYREVKIAKLHRMKEFAEALMCRRKVLLSYFGEHLNKDCGNCDVCTNPPKQFDGTEIAQKALSAIIRLERQEQAVGINMLIDILRGSRRQEIFKNGYDKIRTYGAGGNFSFAEWQYFMQQLLNLGLIEIAYDESSIVKRTSAAHPILYEQQRVSLVKRDSAMERRKAEKAAKPKSKKELAFEELFEKLRQLRLTIARAEGKPPYVVFSDASLRDMTNEMPCTAQEFLEISGVGNKKLATYGEPFMNAIREFVVEKELANQRVKRGQSHIASYHFYTQGLSIEEISDKRNRKPLTIATHIAELYERGENIKLARFITRKDVAKVLEVLEESEPPYSLKPIYEALNEMMPYHKIRLALAYYERNK
jgi:ATP-dependent DNA helicase RecQ